MQTASWVQRNEALSGPFFWLSAFYVVYCARPEDWLPGFHHAPLAKITGILAVLGLLVSLGKTPRGFNDLPRESFYLIALIILMFVSAVFSPLWHGGAFFEAFDFSKVYIAWILTFLLVTSTIRLRRVIFIQVISVALVSLVAIVKGHSVPRLAGVIGGIYSNPNDFAFAIALSLPFCLAFFVSATDFLRKATWLLVMLIMTATLFLTASRAGFIDLAVSGTVCLWYLGVKGRRMYLIAGTVLVGAALLVAAGGRLQERFAAISDEDQDLAAYESFEQRKLLVSKAFDAAGEYPLLGLGAGNFVIYSETWKEVHVSYLQIAAEGGIGALVLYLLFFARGFANLRLVRRAQPGHEISLLGGALHSSLIGFAVGACFAPEAYQYFPYFAVCYTSILVSITRGEDSTEVMQVRYSASGHRIVEAYAVPARSTVLTPAQ